MLTPSTYQITIKGSLDEGWSNRLGGLEIAPVWSGDGQPATILAGEMVDQTALLSVLNMLYDLHLAILSVERLPTEVGST